MTTSTLDLAQVFSAVQKELAQNQASLNQADTYNHDHGTNMVKTFGVITQAVREKQGAAPADQLQYASQVLRSTASSGSAKQYSQGLADAAVRYQGKQVTPDNAMELITALMGSAQPQQSQAPAASADLMAGLAGSLLGGLMGGGQSSQAPSAGADPMAGLLDSLMGGGQQSQAPSAGADPMAGLAGSLLGGLMGGEQPSQAPSGQAQGGFDAGDLLQAGMAYMQAKQQGATPLEAVISAVMAASPMNDSPHHQQSGSLIIKTLMQVIGSMAKK